MIVLTSGSCRLGPAALDHLVGGIATDRVAVSVGDLRLLDDPAPRGVRVRHGDHTDRRCTGESKSGELRRPEEVPIG
jgi:hypothetical protein